MHSFNHSGTVEGGDDGPADVRAENLPISEGEAETSEKENTNRKKSNSDGEEIVKLKHRLRAETVQKDAIAAEMQRLRKHLSQVESTAAQDERQFEFIEKELRHEVKEATKQMRAATEQADELDRQLAVERERSQALEQEHQRVMIERHGQATNDAEIEESQLRLKKMETENRLLARQFDDMTKQSDFAREAQREAARNAIEIQEKLDATERKLEEEQKRNHVLTNECHHLRGEVRQIMRDATEMGTPSAVPRLSLGTFKPPTSQRAAAAMTPRFTPRGGAGGGGMTPRFTPRACFYQDPNTSLLETPRPYTDEEYTGNIPFSNGGGGDGGDGSGATTHRRSNSLETVIDSILPVFIDKHGDRRSNNDDTEVGHEVVMRWLSGWLTRALSLAHSVEYGTRFPLGRWQGFHLQVGVC